MVEQLIDTKDAPPVSMYIHRIPYVLREELSKGTRKFEKKLDVYIEKPNSLALMLV